MRGQRLIYRPGLRVDLEDFEVPAPGPGQLLLAVTRSQVSAGSEVNALRAIDAAGDDRPGSGAPGSGAPGRQMGYTTVGRVLAVGPGGEGFREGDRVLAFGNHASHVLADLNPPEVWRSVPDRLPQGVTDEQACFAVLGDVALHGVRRAAVRRSPCRDPRSWVSAR